MYRIERYLNIIKYNNKFYHKSYPFFTFLPLKKRNPLVTTSFQIFVTQSLFVL